MRRVRVSLCVSCYQCVSPFEAAHDFHETAITIAGGAPDAMIHSTDRHTVTSPGEKKGDKLTAGTHSAFIWKDKRFRI